MKLTFGASVALRWSQYFLRRERLEGNKIGLHHHRIATAPRYGRGYTSSMRPSQHMVRVFRVGAENNGTGKALPLVKRRGEFVGLGHSNASPQSCSFPRSLLLSYSLPSPSLPQRPSQQKPSLHLVRFSQPRIGFHDRLVSASQTKTLHGFPRTLCGSAYLTKTYNECVGLLVVCHPCHSTDRIAASLGHAYPPVHNLRVN
jgi:hypothetical protein